MTRVFAVWKEDGDTYEDIVTSNWAKGNCFCRKNFKCVDPWKNVKNLIVHGKNFGL